MKYLSLGRQEFSNLINENLIYVDKTEYIFRLITEGRAYFLSRPRRFGKSLLVNTLKEIFLGNQHYFKDLWIENKIEWKKYPVIQLDMASLDYREQTLLVALQKKLHRIADSYQIPLEITTPKEMFENLITQLFEQTQQQVVILIDEYDKPIIDYLHNIPQAEENREALKNLYSTLKPTDKYLKFVFITGVSKFAKVSIFSDLNHLTDITLDKDYAKMLGYTQNELEFYFADKLKSAATSLELTEKELLEKVKYWYNGYSWDAKSTVYNPFSVQNFLLQEKFSNFWFSTGTPTFDKNIT
jgi:Predicted AAA-ATPase